MYGCESWTVKKADCRRIDAFELWCCRRLLRVPWTARRSNQSILKEISPGCSLEGLILKLKLQYFGHLMRRVDSFEKTLMLGGIGAGGEGDDRGWDGWMVSPTRWTWVWVNFGNWWWTGRPGVLRFMGLQRVGHNWGTELHWKSKWDNLKDGSLRFVSYVCFLGVCIFSSLWAYISISLSRKLQRFRKCLISKSLTCVTDLTTNNLQDIACEIEFYSVNANSLLNFLPTIFKGMCLVKIRSQKNAHRWCPQLSHTLSNILFSFISTLFSTVINF